MGSMSRDLRETAEGVFYARNDKIPFVGTEMIDELAKIASFTRKKRARICMHSNERSSTHVMIIALEPDSEIKPHSHIQNDEFYYLIKGELELVKYNEQGVELENIHLKPLNVGTMTMCKMPSKTIHTVKSVKETAIYIEITNGPFNTSNTKYYSFG
jgi:cupin fold WbuC family metalloprotein